MELTFLGTTCMMPTKERNHYAVYLEREGEGILFDCGEGTQRQMKIAGIKPSKVNKIFISHWHGDHVLGIPGLLQTMGASDYKGKLLIYGPKGTQEKIKNMFNVFIFDNQLEMEIIDITEDGPIFENKEYTVDAYKLDHSVETYGFRLVEKDKLRINTRKVNDLGIPGGPLLGKLQRGEDIEFNGEKYSYKELTNVKEGKILGVISDTRLTNNCHTIAEDADLLISEASYSSQHENKAEEYGHLTSEQAGLIANQANVQKLILTHFSQRYKNIDELQNDVKTVFDNSVCAYDFMKVKF